MARAFRMLKRLMLSFDHRPTLVALKHERMCVNSAIESQSSIPGHLLALFSKPVHQFLTHRVACIVTARIKGSDQARKTSCDNNVVVNA